MIRNFVAGVLWGGVVAGVGLSVISQVTPMPVVARMSQPDVTPKASAPVAPKPKDVALQAVPPVPAKPDPGLDATTKAPAAPQDQPEPVVTAANDAATKTPTPPAGDEGAAVMTAPEKPQAQATEAAPKPSLPAAKAGTIPLDAPPDAPTAAPAALAKPKAAGGAPALTPGGDEAPVARAPQGLPAAANAELAPANAELPPPPAANPDESLLSPAPLPVEPAPSAIVPDPALVPAPPKPGVRADTAPDTLAPVEGLQDKVAGVTTGRLPRIGATDPAAVAPDAPVIPDDAPPIVRFARPFQNDSGKPLFAVILRDTGGAEVDRAKLAALPFAVTFVVDPLADTAAQAATIYRAAGQEVVMLASGIPEGAQASDLEQTFQSHAGTLPDAVAVMDLGRGGFQDNRPLATQVVPLIKSQGRGLITFDRGLNAADQVARREDVPSATIFRQLDVDGEDAPVIRRYLDRAAFKAAQEGRVMVLGDTRAETIAALMEWTIEGRASSVTLAPVTAVMAVR